jgi:hypothetical protein
MESRGDGVTETFDAGRLDAAGCRLCGGSLDYRFQAKVLRKYDVKYYECRQCHSLQTERPYWLDEAHTQNINADTGAAQRNIHNLSACFLTCKLFGVVNAIDVGGGDGLLCRLLRDYRINCFVNDKYAKPTYALGFTEPDFQRPDLVIAFEVIEHFRDPGRDLDAIFASKPALVMMSTGIYDSQPDDWWYLWPEGGAHVFFYSRGGLALIAEQYGYDKIISGGFILFVAKSSASPTRMFLARLLLSKLICRIFRALIVLLPAPGVWIDRDRVLAARR